MALADDVRPLFPAGVLVAVAPIDAEPVFRHDKERVAVERAVLKRRRQFATGRRLAHDLLDALDVPDAPLLPGNDRAPIWPEAVVGSLSHSDELCIVAVAPAERFRALGVDHEPATDLATDLWDMVLRPAEHAWIDSQPEDQRGVLAKLVFSAKECVYKAVSADVGMILEFADVELSIEPDGRGFSARVVREGVQGTGGEIRGRVLHTDAGLVTAAARSR